MKSHLRIYSAEHFVSLEGLAKALGVSHMRRTELSLLEWNDPDVVLDEIITFFPLRRSFERDLSGVVSALVKSSFSGVLITLRLYDSMYQIAVEEFLTAVSIALSTCSASGRSAGDFVIVIENYTKGSICIGSVPVPVHSVDATIAVAGMRGGVTYQIRTMGRRPSHYVNLALKVLRRHRWCTLLEISGHGDEVGTVVGVSEILKRYLVVKEKGIATGVREIPDAASPRSGHLIRVPKLSVLLERVAFKPDSSTLSDHVAEQDT